MITSSFGLCFFFWRMWRNIIHLFAIVTTKTVLLFYLSYSLVCVLICNVYEIWFPSISQCEAMKNARIFLCNLTACWNFKLRAYDLRGSVTSYPRERVLTHFTKKEARSCLYRLSIWLACDLSHPFVSLPRANNG